ncbi:hypothetical protein [Capnocytophaga canis]|uniref:hypothetical protein n=1 Tax=Capnocytophaga canis TaxID=1848903 RepID=UPI0037D1197F
MNTQVRFTVKVTNKYGNALINEVFSTEKEAMMYAQKNILSVDGDALYSDEQNLQLYIDKEIYNEDDEIVEEENVFSQLLLDVVDYGGSPDVTESYAYKKYVWRAKKQKIE